ncbi:MAG TPA: hypothetical protein V6C57_02705 [Coleofasciculaceae cyanobacterium]
MILKRLGIGKKSEYFLEAPPLSQDESQVNAKKVDPQPKPESTAAGITPADVKAAQIAEAPAAAESASSQKKSKQAKAAVDQPKTAVAPKAAAPKVEPATANFATDYLIPKDTPRRRPGPSLDMFKDMAKQVNPRK